MLVAVLFEIGWAADLKHTELWWEWGATGIAIFLSFYLLISATKVLPMGIAYAVWTGIGASGELCLE